MIHVALKQRAGNLNTVCTDPAMDQTQAASDPQPQAATKDPMVWASQVEIQAAVDLYGVPIYLFTPNVSGSGYHWYCYSKRTLAAPELKHHHIELAHQYSVYFHCIVDATTRKPCTVPPQLTGEDVYYPHVL